ncbi:MAG: alpha/beta hydrolase, partial [Bacteroidota bacterium]
MKEIKDFVNVNGHQLYYELTLVDDSENKPLIVFLHEGLGSIQQWKNFPEEFCMENFFSFLVYDRYGHGKSEILSGPRSNNFVFEQADELNELLTKIGITRNFFLFGHSDGATIALIHAAHYPDKVLGVVSEAAHVVIEEFSCNGLMKAEEAYEKGKLREGLAKYHGEKTDLMLYGWVETWLRDDFKNWNMFDTLKKIQSPILAIQGTDDEYGTYQQLELIKK